MSQTIKLPNYRSQNLKEYGQLDVDHAVGDTTLVLENVQGFNQPYFAMIGKPLAENSEIVSLGTVVDSKTVNCGALKHKHLAETDTYVLFGTQLSVYRAPNTNGLAPGVANFEPLEVIDMDADQPETVYIDATGGADWWYRFTYKGPTGETNLADSPAVRGGNVGIYCSVDDVRQEAGLGAAKYVTDDIVVPHRNAAQSYIDGMLTGRYVVPFADPVNPWITDICKRLAAGYLLLEQYPQTPERGQSKVDKAKQDIADIVSGQMVLTDAIGVPTASTDGGEGSYWPNDDTANTQPMFGGGERRFRVSDVNRGYDRRY